MSTYAKNWRSPEIDCGSIPNRGPGLYLFFNIYSRDYNTRLRSEFASFQCAELGPRLWALWCMYMRCGLRARAGIYLQSGTKSAAHVRAKMSAPMESARRAHSLTTADRCGRVVRGRSSKSRAAKARAKSAAAGVQQTPIDRPVDDQLEVRKAAVSNPLSPKVTEQSASQP